MLAVRMHSTLIRFNNHRGSSSLMLRLALELFVFLLPSRFEVFVCASRRHPCECRVSGYSIIMFYVEYLTYQLAALPPRSALYSSSQQPAASHPQPLATWIQGQRHASQARPSG